MGECRQVTSGWGENETSTTTLNGGIPDDQLWQSYYNRLAKLPQVHYELPSGQVGARFLNTLASLTNGIVKREHNSEKMLLFAMVILPRVG